MNRRATLIAAACALLGAGALHLYLSRYELEVVGGAAKLVVVATRDVPLGELITRSSVDVRELPERYVEERHIAGEDLERILGTRATTTVQSGASLLWSDLDVAQEGRTLSLLVRAGMRAFSLPEREVSFDGLLRPGDRVDVLFTPHDATLGTTTLLQGALVLTVGGELGGATSDADEPSGRPGRVTLSVTIEQAQQLAHSEQRGTLRLALRNPQDLSLTDGIAPATASSLRGEAVARTAGRGTP